MRIRNPRCGSVDQYFQRERIIFANLPRFRRAHPAPSVAIVHNHSKPLAPLGGMLSACGLRPTMVVVAGNGGFVAPGAEYRAAAHLGHISLGRASVRANAS